MKRLSLLVFVLLFVYSSAFGHSTVYRHLEPETMAYDARVYAGGGMVISPFDVNSSLRNAKEIGYYSAVTGWWSAQFGITMDSIGNISIAWDLSPFKNDALQATGAAQPHWLANQQNGKAGMIFTAATSSLATASSVLPTGSNARTQIFVVKFSSSNNFFAYQGLASSLYYDWGFAWYAGGTIALTSHGMTIWAPTVSPNTAHMNIISLDYPSGSNFNGVREWVNNSQGVFSNGSASTPNTQPTAYSIGPIGMTLCEHMVLSNYGTYIRLIHPFLNGRWVVY